MKNIFWKITLPLWIIPIAIWAIYDLLTFEFDEDIIIW